MIRTGLIGNGYWGKIIESKLLQLSNLIFIQTSKNYNSLVFKNVDWIFIATPTCTHYSIVKDCILKKVNVFVEKPFCLDLKEANELIELALINNVKLYINNIFLFSKEIEYLKTKKIKSIEFKWKKDGPFNDDLINDLLYHDIYILLYLFGLRNIYNVIINTNSNNKLNFKFNYSNIKVKVNYDRLFKKEKFKSINFNGEELIFNRNNNDPLKDLIKKCINNKLDFKSNNILNIQTVKLSNKLRIHLS